MLIKDENEAPLQFNEPAGLCFDASGQLLYIADTNNHRIQLVNMKTLTAKTFKLNFNAIAVTTNDTETDSAPSSGLQLLKSVPLRACLQLKLRVNINLSDELKFTEAAQQRWTLKSSTPGMQASATSGQITNGVLNLQLDRNAALLPAKEEVTLDLALSLCDAKSCLMKRFALVLKDNNVDAAPAGKALDKECILDENINIKITQNEIVIS